MNEVKLSEAIREKARTLRDSDDFPMLNVHADATELLLVLARVIEGKPVDRAFGSPGDWGYNTPIGRALAETAVQR